MIFSKFSGRRLKGLAFLLHTFGLFVVDLVFAAYSLVAFGIFLLQKSGSPDSSPSISASPVEATCDMWLVAVLLGLAVLLVRHYLTTQDLPPGKCSCPRFVLLRLCVFLQVCNVSNDVFSFPSTVFVSSVSARSSFIVPFASSFHFVTFKS